MLHYILGSLALCCTRHYMQHASAVQEIDSNVVLHPVTSRSVTLCKTRSAYFTFYFTLYYSWTHHSSHSGASCFSSREWQIAPSGSRSLWSPLHVAATIIPCATLKHIPFALQFVQPGIITNPLNPPSLPKPILLGSLWVNPIHGLFCPLWARILCFLCPVCARSGKRAKCQSMNRICARRNPELNFIHITTSAAVLCSCRYVQWVVDNTLALYRQIFGVNSGFCHVATPS